MTTTVRDPAELLSCPDGLRLTAVPLVPEISLYLPENERAFRIRMEEEAERRLSPPYWPPFWSSAWAGGQALARYVLDQMGIHPLAELSILLVDTAAMEQLHIQWMDEPGPTDVLSFPMDELRPSRAEDDNEPTPGLLGDVVLCPEVAAKQGEAAGHSMAD